MGHDKTRLVYEGSTLARRTGSLLELVVDVALEIGPGHSGLVALEEEPRGQGPLAAIVAGRRALLERGYDGSALIVACDMPLLSEDLLRFLVAFDTTASVVPVVEGRVQPLCAKWGATDLDAASHLYSRGERSLRFLATAPGVILLSESQWSVHASRANFTDVDTPDEARRLGLVV
jgi:molybdopterin-guanine dinucleotide biosynthesis protein A